MSTDHLMSLLDGAQTAPLPMRPRGADRRPGRRPEPRRRYGVGSVLTAMLAELLLVGGVVCGLFVAWQGWWTDVVAEKHQHELVEQLKLPDPPKGATASGAHGVGDPPVLPQPSGVGDIFGTLQVPRWGSAYDQPIAQGTDRAKVLNEIGLGHYPETVMPGGLGNFSVAGHRVTYGKPLNRSAELEVGDSLVVRATDHKGLDVWYVYKVTGHTIVTPEHTEVIAPVPNHPGQAADDRYITLTSCHPMWSAKERFVVFGELDYWMPAANGTPKELTQGVAS